MHRKQEPGLLLAQKTVWVLLAWARAKSMEQKVGVSARWAGWTLYPAHRGGILIHWQKLKWMTWSHLAALTFCFLEQIYQIL